MANYTFETVDKKGSTSTILYGINSGAKTKNTIAVGTYRDSDGDIAPLIDVNGHITTIGKDQLHGAQAQALGVNDYGVVVGSYTVPGAIHGFVYNNGKLITVDEPKGQYTEVVGISNEGEIVGAYFDAKGQEHGFTAQISKNGKSVSNYQTVDVKGGTSVVVNGVNDSGEIVGSYFKGNVQLGFTETAKGDFTSIKYPGAASTSVNGINKSGEIVGTYRDSSGASHGFVEKGGKFTAIDDPDGSSTAANGIDNSGQVVGQYLSDKQRGFIASPTHAQIAHALFDAAFSNAPIANSGTDHAAASTAPTLVASDGGHSHMATHS